MSLALDALNLRGLWDCPGGPEARGSPSNVGGVGLTPGWGARIPHALQPKKQIVNSRSNTVTQSIKTWKMVHIKNLQKK